MCSMNGSASGPSSATMNGTRCAIKPAINATSRESRHGSSDTNVAHFARVLVSVLQHVDIRLRQCQPQTQVDALTRRESRRGGFWICAGFDGSAGGRKGEPTYGAPPDSGGCPHAPG